LEKKIHIKYIFNVSFYKYIRSADITTTIRNVFFNITISLLEIAFIAI